MNKHEIYLPGYNTQEAQDNPSKWRDGIVETLKAVAIEQRTAIISQANKQEGARAMTKAEYQAYQERVKQFMDSEGINNLSPVLSDEESPFFSAMPCDCCKTTLAGDRWTASGYNPTTKEVHHFDSVCNDCIYYAEYGQLDDMTMANMEDCKQ